MPERVSITDNRTGESTEIPITAGGVDSGPWSRLLPGVWFSDPSFGATSGADSAVTEVDGDKGYLRYRGYPIEQLAEGCSFLEVAYLLINGALPNGDQLEGWIRRTVAARSFG